MKNVSWFLNAFQINDSKEMSFSNFFSNWKKKEQMISKNKYFWVFQGHWNSSEKSHKDLGLILSFKNYFKLLIAELSKIRNSKS